MQDTHWIIALREQAGTLRKKAKQDSQHGFLPEAIRKEARADACELRVEKLRMEQERLVTG